MDSKEHLLTLQKPLSRDSCRSMAIICDKRPEPSIDCRIDDADKRLLPFSVVRLFLSSCFALSSFDFWKKFIFTLGNRSVINRMTSSSSVGSAASIRANCCDAIDADICAVVVVVVLLLVATGFSCCCFCCCCCCSSTVCMRTKGGDGEQAFFT